MTDKDKLCEYKWDGSHIYHGPVVHVAHEGDRYGTMYDNTQVLIVTGNYYTIFYNEIRKILGFTFFKAHYWGNLIFIPTDGEQIKRLTQNKLTNGIEEKIANLYAFRSFIGDGMGSKSFIFKLNDEYYDMTLCTKYDTNKRDLSRRNILYIKNNTVEDIIRDFIIKKYGKKDAIHNIIFNINKNISKCIDIISGDSSDIKCNLTASQEYIRNNIYDILV